MEKPLLPVGPPPPVPVGEGDGVGFGAGFGFDDDGGGVTFPLAMSGFLQYCVRTSRVGGVPAGSYCPDGLVGRSCATAGRTGALPDWATVS